MKQNYLLESIARSIAYDKTLKTKYTLMMQRQKKNNNRNKWLRSQFDKKGNQMSSFGDKNCVYFEEKKKQKGRRNIQSIFTCRKVNYCRCDVDLFALVSSQFP